MMNKKTFFKFPENSDSEMLVFVVWISNQIAGYRLVMYQNECRKQSYFVKKRYLFVYRVRLSRGKLDSWESDKAWNL